MIEAFGSGGRPLTQIEIAHATKLPYPTVWRILMTLIDVGLVEVVPVSGHYCLTSKALALSAGFQDRLQLVRRYRRAMDELCREVMWPISLSTPAGNSMIVHYSTHSATSLTYTVYQPGYATPMGKTASGLAYLSALSDDESARLIRGLGLARLDLKILQDHIARARADGFGTYERSDFNPTPGKLSTIAVPLRVDDSVAGALSLSYFVNAFPLKTAVERYIPRLLDLVARPAPIEAPA